jgi:haloalkane dehalogenase
MCVPTWHSDPLRRQYGVVDGVRTAWVDEGLGEPLVAIHGIPTCADLFAELPSRLGGVRLIAPDLLGLGETAAPPNGRWGAAASERHLAAFLDEVPPERFHLLVHDFGGVLGLPWAAANLRRLRSLTVLSTIAAPALRWSLLAQTLYLINLVGGRAALRGIMRYSSKGPAPSSEILARFVAPWSRGRVLRDHDHFSRARLRRVSAAVARLPLPALVVWGKDDDVFPERSGQALASALPQATFRSLSSCGHWSPLDAPDALSDELTAFLSSVAGGGDT